MKKKTTKLTTKQAKKPIACSLAVSGQQDALCTELHR